MSQHDENIDKQWADIDAERAAKQRDCRHKFIDSTHCLKCGWIPPAVSVPPDAALRERLAVALQNHFAEMPSDKGLAASTLRMLLPLLTAEIAAAEDRLLVEVALLRLERWVVQPCGSVGDDSDYEQCFLCGASARGQIRHRATCLILRALDALDEQSRLRAREAAQRSRS